MIDKLADEARHKVWCMGRRWRKSTAGLLATICGHGPTVDGQPMSRGALQGANIWWVTESFPVAESVWLAVSGILGPAAKHVSEAHHRVTLQNGGALTVKSAANPASLKGSIRAVDGVMLDEAAFHSSKVWQRSLRPALSDSKGWSIHASTPDGFNHFKDLYDAAAAGLTDWRAWREPSTANPFFDPAEIEASRLEGMSERDIQQEYFAEFLLSGSARAYFAFDRDLHLSVAPFDRLAPLDLCLNYGIAPAAWLVTQVSSGQERVLSEIAPSSDDTSPRAYLQEFRRLYPQRSSGQNVRIYGEVSQTSSRSDFEIIRAGLPRAQVFVRQKPMAEKDRINAVNQKLRDSYGEVGATIDPSCIRLIRDFEGTRNVESSFRVTKETGMGFYAAALGAKYAFLYPAILDTILEQSSARRWPVSTPEARRCHRAVERALETGRLVKPPHCEECSERNGIQAAHFNYEEPLRVRWLCQRHHSAWDLAEPKGGTVPRSTH